jgi:hypothetical protein
MPKRDQRMLLWGAAATSAVLLVCALAGDVELVGYLLPLCVLAMPLLAGRYVGEDTLERLREGRTARRGRVAPAPLAGIRRAAAAFPRGGRLIAHALAERGPPAAALT